MIRRRPAMLWKQLLSLLLMAALLPGFALAETRVPYGELPADVRALYEAEVISARDNARARAPGNAQFQARARGDFHGYTDSRAKNSLRVSYEVSDSIVQEGEKVSFVVSMSCEYPPMLYLLGGLAFDENFVQTGDLASGNPEGVLLGADVTDYTLRVSYTPRAAGYFNFILVVKDGNGNAVTVTTNTVQVYEGDEPLFNNVGADGSLALSMNLDRSTLDVGTDVTVNVSLTAEDDPVKYRGVWTLKDDAGNLLDAAETTEEVVTDGKQVQRSFTYRPLQAGKLQFVITASDSAGNQIKNNTPVLTVADGFWFTARMDRLSALPVGERVTADYAVHGHDCGGVSYYTGWECYSAEGVLLASQADIVENRSGQSAYQPRVGQNIEFYAGATCEHFPGEYPARAFLTLVDGLAVELTPTASAVRYGSSIGLRYSILGGFAPYQQIVVKGYTRSAGSPAAHCFLNETVTAAEGTLSGTPQMGDEVWFEVQVVESDGHSSTWTSAKIPLTGAPTAPAGDANGDGAANAADGLLILQYAAGWPVTLNMTDADADGSGSVDLNDALLLLRHGAGENVPLQSSRTESFHQEREVLYL